jgi:hypothetical protein
MKKQALTISILLLLTATDPGIFAQGKEKGHQKKEQPPAKDNKGRSDVIKSKDQGQGQGEGKGQGQGKGQGEGEGQGNGKKDLKEDDRIKVKMAKDNGRGKEDVRRVIAHFGNRDLYRWDEITFRDRHKYRNEGKVTVCHKFNRTDEPAVAINISRNALKAHLGHGDIEGPCPVYSGPFSRVYIDNRRDYYDVLYGAQDQVIYSQYILDYALERLTGARSELLVLQNNNAPVYMIERRQAVITELEDNVSLLEVALAAVAGLLVAKLVN